MWATELNGGLVSVTPSGELIEHGLPGVTRTIGIARGAENNFWVTGDNKTKPLLIDEIPGSNAFANRQTAPLGLENVAVGSDGLVWFTDASLERVGSSAPFIGPPAPELGEWEQSAMPCASGANIEQCPFLDPIVAGPDGALWYAGFEGAGIGRIDTLGSHIEYSLGLGGNTGVNSMVVGPEGNIWFTEELANRIGYITPAGKVTQLAELTPGAEPFAITVGPDQNLWFTESGTARVGRVIPDVPPVVSTGGVTGAAPSSATLQGSVRPRGADTSYVFQYGTTAGYGASSAASDVGAGDAPVGAGAAVGGLAPSTVYHYRVVASNAHGTSYGADQSFATPAAPAPPPEPRTSVARYKVTLILARLIRHHALETARLVLGGLSAGEHVSFRCTHCTGRHTHGSAVAHSSHVAFTLGRLVLTARSKLIVTVTAADRSTRVRVYSFQPRSKLEPTHFGETCHVASRAAPVGC